MGAKAVSIDSVTGESETAASKLKPEKAGKSSSAVKPAAHSAKKAVKPGKSTKS
jgi:hypothetical protein